MFRCSCFCLFVFFFLFFLTNKELPFCSVGEPLHDHGHIFAWPSPFKRPIFHDPSLLWVSKSCDPPSVSTSPPLPLLESDKSLNLMSFPWNFRRQTLYRDRSVLNTNSKIYLRKTTGRLLIVKKQCKRISWQWRNICPTEPIKRLWGDTTRLRSEAKHMFSYLDFRCYFEANGPNHIHFL